MKDKQGNKLTFKEYMGRWKEGIKNITPLQRLQNESRGTFISLIGYIACLVVLIIFRDKFFVNWFAYGLILIFVGSIWTTGLKFLVLRQQLKIFKNLDNQFNLPDLKLKLDNQVPEKEDETKQETDIQTDNKKE